MFTHSLGEIKTSTIQAGDDALDLALSGHGRHAMESPTGSGTPTRFTVREVETARSLSATRLDDKGQAGTRRHLVKPAQSAVVPPSVRRYVQRAELALGLPDYKALASLGLSPDPLQQLASAMASVRTEDGEKAEAVFDLVPVSEQRLARRECQCSATSGVSASAEALGMCPGIDDLLDMAKIDAMTIPLSVDRILGDRSFTEIGDPVLATADERRGLLAVAGAYEFGGTAPVGVYGTGDLACHALVRSRYAVHTMAFHPTLPLLAVGTGHYDGGYFFEGELLLLHLETGTAVSLIEHWLGRQVLKLEWLDEQALRVVMAPPDDWQDETARVEGHVAVVRRSDWTAVPAKSLTEYDLAGPRVPAPRPDGSAAACRMVTELSADWESRRNVRAVESLSDGRILATLDGVQLESWLPSGERAWTVPDKEGGREIVVAPDERTAWVGLTRRPGMHDSVPQSVVQLSLTDGKQLDSIVPSSFVSLVRCADGRPALSPDGRNRARSRFPVRGGSRIYFQSTLQPPGERNPYNGERWVTAMDLQGPTTARPVEPLDPSVRWMFPYSWEPGETHFGGPGIEAADGTLLHAGTVYHGQGLQPGGSFVVRREPTDGRPRWVFRTDRKATVLDADAATVYVGYDDGEVVALDLGDGTVRWRQHLTVGAVSAVPTALTVTATGRFLIGTSDGRILECSAA
ncbi:outer membrane protein assembly factor BamB family protein [Streptomyces erythrochromogenes]|uniref:outer membrane protein assembly factor BamB family protein n=1 Tax=Streptomyces erythrochromogenes TaxID=285574 RepID=UPI003826D808